MTAAEKENRECPPPRCPVCMGYTYFHRFDREAWELVRRCSRCGNVFRMPVEPEELPAQVQGGAQ